MPYTPDEISKLIRKTVRALAKFIRARRDGKLDAEERQELGLLLIELGSEILADGID